MNHVSLGGNVTNDPETKELGPDQSVTSFGIAHNKRRKEGDEWISVPYFFSVTVWGNYGKLIASKLRKGDQCFLSGELTFSSWEVEGGSKRSKVSITASQVEGEFQYRKREEQIPASLPPNGEPIPDHAQRAPAFPEDDIPF